MTTWRVVGKSVRGASHESRGENCQDAHGWADRDGRVIMVVADGAGSAPLGGLGATIAVAGALEALTASTTDLQADVAAERSELVAAAYNALKKLSDEAERRGVVVHDLACTLIMTAVRQNSVCAAQIGDGAVVFRNGVEKARLLTSPQRGEFVNETVFLTSQGALEQIEYAAADGDVTAVAAFTDGLEPISLVFAEEAHDPFFRAVFDWLQSAKDGTTAGQVLEDFLLSARVRARTDDDLTLVAAVAFSNSGPAGQ